MEFEQLFLEIKQGALILKKFQETDTPPLQVDSLHYPFVQSCLLLKYLEELASKLKWLALQIPDSLSRSYSEEIQEIIQKIEAFSSLLCQPVESSNLAELPAEVLEFYSEQPSLAFLLTCTVADAIKQRWAEKYGNQNLYQVGARTVLALFRRDLTDSSFLHSVAKFYIQQRQAFRVSDMLSTLSRPNRQELMMGLHSAFKSRTCVIPWLRKLVCDEITANSKVSLLYLFQLDSWDQTLKVMKMVAHHSERTSDVEQTILLLKQIAQVPGKFELQKFEVLEAEFQIWKTRRALTQALLVLNKINNYQVIEKHLPLFLESMHVEGQCAALNSDIQFSQHLTVALHSQLTISSHVVLRDLQKYLRSLLYSTDNQCLEVFSEMHKSHLLYASILFRKDLIDSEESAEEIVAVIQEAVKFIRLPFEGESLVAASLVDVLLDQLIPLTKDVKEVWLPGSSNLSSEVPFHDFIQDKTLHPTDFTGFERKIQNNKINLTNLVDQFALFRFDLHFPQQYKKTSSDFMEAVMLLLAQTMDNPRKNHIIARAVVAHHDRKLLMKMISVYANLLGEKINDNLSFLRNKFTSSSGILEDVTDFLSLDYYLGPLLLIYKPEYPQAERDFVNLLFKHNSDPLVEDILKMKINPEVVERAIEELS